MIFLSEDFYIDMVKDKDLHEIISIYNSNEHFLISHIDEKEVTKEWITQELKSIEEAGFNFYKIVEVSSEKIIGIMDLKIDDETYLSLLMLHNHYKSKGIGKVIFKALEKHLILNKSKCIRICGYWL